MSRPTASLPALRQILQQELALGRRLLALAEAQSEAIITSDAARLNELELAQREALNEQGLLEVSRLAAVRELAWTQGLERVPTLAGLLPGLAPRERDALEALRQQMLAVQTRMESVNARNRGLLENALSYVQFSLDLLTAAALQPARYGTNLNTLKAPTFYIDSKA